MRRHTGSKTGGAQRRLSSGSLRFGLLSVHDTKLLPTESANFSFETGSTNASHSKAQRAPSSNIPEAEPAHDRNISTAHDPIPLPTSHIHRTTSELNILLGGKHATKREEAMFQRIVSGMANCQSDARITVSLKSTAGKHTEVSTTSVPHIFPSANQCGLKKARDSSRSLLSRVTADSEKVTKWQSSSYSSTAHNDSLSASRIEQDEFFVGSFRDYAKLTPPRLLKLQEAALGIDAPIPTDRSKFSDVNSDQKSETVYDNGELSDDDEFFPLDM